MNSIITLGNWRILILQLTMILLNQLQLIMTPFRLFFSYSREKKNQETIFGVIQEILFFVFNDKFYSLFRFYL